MSLEKWQAVDRYISDLLIPPDSALDEALRTSAAAGLPPINVSPPQGRLLMILGRTMNARKILEIGTLGGYSTIWLARSLSPGGRLITLEIDPLHARVASSNIARAGLDDAVDLRIGRALDLLPEIAEEEGSRGGFDLVFIDADKESNSEYLAWALRLSHVGTVIVVDNVIRKGAVIEESTSDSRVQGVRRFNEALAAEPRVIATEIQTVGSKGYDGFAIAVVVADS